VALAREQSAAGILRQALRRSGLTARELARRTSVSEARISDYVHGRHDPRAGRLLDLVEATGHRLLMAPKVGSGGDGVGGDGAGAPGTRVFELNGMRLAELLDLGEALTVGRKPGRFTAPRRFVDLVTSSG
jgi:transcriptional regulator with XRE-family HTH domain